MYIQVGACLFKGLI